MLIKLNMQFVGPSAQFQDNSSKALTEAGTSLSTGSCAAAEGTGA